MFSTAAALHKHLEDRGHHSEPPRGGFAVQPRRGADMVDAELAAASGEQSRVVRDILRTGRHAWVGGVAGTGKSWVARALVSIGRALLGASAVAYLHPTNMSAYSTGDAAAATLYAAFGFGRPPDTLTVADLASQALRDASVRCRGAEWLLIVIDEGGRVPWRELSAMLDVVRTLNCELACVDGRAGRAQVVVLGDVGQLLDWTHTKLRDNAAAEAPPDAALWLRTALGDELDPLVFELTKVWRQQEADFVDALARNRSGEAWRPGQHAYDFFARHCSRTTEGNGRYLTTDGDGRERATLDAVDAGYVVLVATNREAAEGNAFLREEARRRALRAHEQFLELRLEALDAVLRLSDRKRIGFHTCKVKDDGAGAPPVLHVASGLPVALTMSVRVTVVGPAGTLEEVKLPSGLQGRVTGIMGSNLDTAAITVRFPRTDLLPVDVEHTFRAEWVDDPNESNGCLPSRRQVQLREGGFLSIHKSQSLGLPRAIVDCYGIRGGAWITGSLYTANSRAFTKAGLLLANMLRGECVANTAAMAFVSERAARTRTELRAEELVRSTPLVARDVASFLAQTLRSTEQAACLALQVVGRRPEEGEEAAAGLAAIASAMARERAAQERARERLGRDRRRRRPDLQARVREVSPPSPSSALAGRKRLLRVASSSSTLSESGSRSDRSRSGESLGDGSGGGSSSSSRGSSSSSRGSSSSRSSGSNSDDSGSSE